MEKIRFPTNPEVGKFYEVPCIKSLEGKYVPVNSYLHTDHKIIKASFAHWHIDWRFVSEKMWREEIERNYIRYSKVVTEVGIALVLVEGGQLYVESTAAIDKTIHYKRIKCKRNYSAGKFFIEKRKPEKDWTNELQKYFKGSKLKECDNALICPHKGVHIDKNCKDEKGNYVCPGHLLRFNPKTLKCI